MANDYNILDGTDPESTEGGALELLIDAKGDLIVGTAADTADNLTVGADTFVLTADSAEASGLKWAAPSGGGGGIDATLLDAKGDIIAASAADTAARLAAGANGTYLRALSSEATGLEWGAHNSTGDPHTQYALDTDLSTHEADTTSVHGIADTSALSLTSHDHSGTYVALSTVDAAGDLLVGTADNTVGRLAKGSALDVLRVNAGGTALEYAAPAAGGGGSAIFGDGNDGVIDFDGSTTRLGLVPSSGVYTLTRDIYLAGGSQISGTAVVRTSNFRVFCSGTFTVGATATLHNNGNNASGLTGGATVNANGTVGSITTTSAGGNGATGAGASGSISTTNYGGFGGGTTGGGGQRNPTAIAASYGGLRSVPAAIFGGYNNFNGTSTATQRDYGGCGGSGAGGDGTNAGGGGGGGAGVMVLAAKGIVNSGAITATGGAGANGVAGNANGGGGGGGGVVILVYNTYSGNAATAAGGAKGLKAGSGADGNNGGAGTVISLVNA